MDPFPKMVGVAVEWPWLGHGLDSLAMAWPWLSHVLAMVWPWLGYGCVLIPALGDDYGLFGVPVSSRALPCLLSKALRLGHDLAMAWPWLGHGLGHETGPGQMKMSQKCRIRYFSAIFM